MAKVYEWSNKEQLIEDLKNSHGISDFLDQRGYVASSGNYDTFKKWMRIHEINKDDYFKKEKKPVVIHEPNKIKEEVTAQDVLCINSKYTRKEANRVIRKDNLLAYQCACCENKGQWQGKSLTLQLEHKNGDSTDNRIENLEYLCPNCHSQTGTYGSKNKHNRIFEERIRDILEQNICDTKTLEILAKKWNSEISTAYGWLNKYKNKIKEYTNILENIKKPKTKNLIQNLDQKLIEERLKDLEMLQDNIDFEKQLSEKWKISIVAVRKWIKSNNVKTYNKKYVTTLFYKVKVHQQEQDEKIYSIVEKHNTQKRYEKDELLPFFNMNIGSCAFYLKNKDLELYYKYFPKITCKYCKGENAKISGFEQLKYEKKQGYKCTDCKKYFY